MRMRAARAARSCAAVMKPCSRIRVSTTWLRSSAPSWLVHGESADGARASPAISAHSGEVEGLRRPTEQVPRHRLDAVDARAQVDAVQIQLEDLLLASAAESISSARAASLILRPYDFWFERNSVRASCCVSVLPPFDGAAERTSRTTARPSPIGSMPGWMKKR